MSLFFHFLRKKGNDERTPLILAQSYTRIVGASVTLDSLSPAFLPPLEELMDWLRLISEKKITSQFSSAPCAEAFFFFFTAIII